MGEGPGFPLAAQDAVGMVSASFHHLGLVFPFPPPNKKDACL